MANVDVSTPMDRKEMKSKAKQPAASELDEGFPAERDFNLDEELERCGLSLKPLNEDDQRASLSDSAIGDDSVEDETGNELCAKIEHDTTSHGSIFQG